MRCALFCSLVLGLGCTSSSPRIIDEPAVAPLPPASGTPIGILIDEAQDLALRDPQLEALRGIDQRLSTRNDAIDAQLGALDRPAAPPPGDGQGAGGPKAGGRRGGRGGGGRGGGGMGGGGMGGGGMGGPAAGTRGAGGRGHGGRGNPRSAAGGAHDSAMLQQLRDERGANVREALEQAFILLDEEQRITARKILDARGGGDAPTPTESSPAGETPDGAQPQP